MQHSSFLAFHPFNPFLSWFDAATRASESFFVGPSANAGGAPSDVHPMTTHEESHSVFVPSHPVGARPPMVVMLHGASQNPLDFAAGTAMNAAAEQSGFVVLYPAQPGHANAHRCWHWFDAAHQSREQGDPARIVRITLETARAHGVDMNRIYVAGFSAGGAMAALLGELFPDIYAAVGVHSGLAPRAGRDLSSALAAMRGGAQCPSPEVSGMPTIVFHGDRDTTVHAVNGEQVIHACVGPATALATEVHAGHDGRRFTRRVYGATRDRVRGEHWVLHGAEHAWSGGGAGTFADRAGPHASEEMLRFFAGHRLLAR
jgi:poly(hydroxyalkanoate) depolymerase family esterase